MTTQRTEGSGRVCPDADQIVDLISILGDDPEEALAHVVGCPDCGALVRTVAMLREAAAATGPVDEALLTERLVRGLVGADVEAPGARWGRAGTRWPLVAANGIVAAATGAFGLLLLASAAPAPDLSPVHALSAAAVVGCIPLMQELRRRRAPGA